MEGVLSLIKPPGMTSHDVVGFVRRLAGIKRVGHTGTLDPLAAGLLVLCVGRATRVSRFLTMHDKCYRAEVTFGIGTATQDAAGAVESETDASSLTAEQITEAVLAQKGEQAQIPPMTSAVRHQGRKLYELARSGREVEREPRLVVIKDIRVVRLEDIGSARPKAVLDVLCSKGTYVRTLCADIGRRAGFPAFNSFLLRTMVGRFRIDRAFALEELKTMTGEAALDECMYSVDEALAHLPAVELKDGACRAVLNGRTVYPAGVRAMPEGVEEGYVRLRSSEQLLAVAEYIRGSDGDPEGFRPVWVRTGSR